MDESNDKTPLELIRRKERELAQRLKDAENRAKEKLAAARERAAEIQREAESAGQREAAQFFDDQMTRLQKAAAAIGEAANRDAEHLSDMGSKHLDRAAQIIIDFVLPK